MNERDSFFCSHCHQDKPRLVGGVGTGYANYTTGLVCYVCCAKLDKAAMIATGKAVLYLAAITPHCTPWTEGVISNWPGTLKFNARVKRGRHNIARIRYDAYFTGPDSKPWHGVQYGERNQLAHCKCIKSKVK